jgi:His/Glu/Gln/Arg/opine family amino acid ABC transporter permease subunit
MFENLLQNLGLSAFSLHGFGPLLMEGTWMTIKLSVLSLLVAVLLGLLGASAKLSKVKLVRIPAQLYTTLIRGVPDLVLMLLIFYSLQTWLTSFTDFMEWEYHPGLHLWRVFHRNLPWRDSRGPTGPGRSGNRVWPQARPAFLDRGVPADDAFCPAGYR